MQRSGVSGAVSVVVGLALAWAAAIPEARAYNAIYVPVYNALVSNLNQRISLCPGSKLPGKTPLATVSQADLQGLRQCVLDLMGGSFRLAPDYFNLSVVSDETFPFGLRFRNGTMVSPSLMDGIGDGQGRFTKIPAEYTQGGQAVYAASFTDAPVLWIHFVELQRAMSRMRYLLITPGANADWTANGTQNERMGYGSDLLAQDAKARCEVNFAATPPHAANSAPGAVTSLIAPANVNGYEAAAVRRSACLKLSGLSTGTAHKAWFYITGNRAAPAPNFYPEYDDNGSGCAEGRWRLWSMVDGGRSSNMLSSVFGGDGEMPAWGTVPAPVTGLKQEGWRGYSCSAAVAMEWDFHDQQLVRPRLRDPEEDGLSDTGCGCSSCPLETAAVWDGLQPQAKVLIPLGVSDGLLNGGLRVKAYLTEYDINGCTQQMYSLFSGIIWTAGGGTNDWEFVCVRRPSGDEIVYSIQGQIPGGPVDIQRKYRLEKAGALFRLRFPQKDREIVHELVGDGVAAVTCKIGAKEMRTAQSSGIWPGLSTHITFGSWGWMLTRVESSLLVAVPGYEDGLVRSVDYQYRSGGPTNRTVYYRGSKGFRTLDAEGRVIWDTRVVTDASNGAVEIWSGITTNGELRVARKERRRNWYDAERELSMVEVTETAGADGLPTQTHTTLVAVATFPWGEEKVSETVGAGSPEAATTRYTYYDDPADSNNYGWLRLVENPDGAWTQYEYDPLGRERLRQSGFKQARAGETHACRTTENVYAGDPSLGPLNMPVGDQVATNDACPRLVVERLAGQEVARTYYSYQPGCETTVRAVRRAAAYDDPGNLVTVTTSLTAGNFKGRPLRIDRPDGQFSVFAYNYDAGRKELTVTEDSGTGTGGLVTNGIRSVTVTDVAQRTLRATTVDIASGIELTGTANTLDWLGRVVCASNRVDGTVSRTQYGCCGPETVLDADGTPTTYVYDELKRLYASERQGVTTFNSYDVLGNVVQTRRSAEGEADLVTSSTFDQAGRLTRTVDERGFATVRSYGTNVLGEPVVTTVYPDHSTMVETSYLDGQPKSVTGDAVRARCYDYGVDEGGAFTVVYEGDDTNALQWTQTYVDMLGRECLVVHPDGYRKETLYDAAGRPVRESDGIGVRLTAYNGKGEAFRSAVDMDGDEVIGLAGPDRVTESDAGCGMFQGKPSRWMEARVYEVAGSGLPTVMSRQWQSVDGTVAWDIAFGRTGRVEVVRQPEAAARRETSFHPDGTRTVSCFTNGHLKSVQRQSATGQVIAEQDCAQDRFGRLSGQTETGPCGGGVQATYRYDAGGNVTGQTVTAAGLTRTTTSDYDAMGRCVRTVLPDGGVVVFEYEPTGERRAQSGARIYPVRYAYDERGRLAALETFRSGTNAPPDVTRWDYDARRGWLTSKVTADGRTTRYEYRADGQVSKRVWARGVETVYGYDAAGSLTNVQYSDGTPGLAMTLDRVGRATVVRDGSGVRTNVYGADGSLAREILPDQGGEVGQDCDVLGRRTNLFYRMPGREVDRVGYQYDGAGRLFSVGAGDLTTWYEYGGDGRTVTGQVYGVAGRERLRGARQYDALGRLGRVAWTRGGDPLAAVEYDHNAADMRTRRTALDGSYWTYEYDELGQVVAGRKATAAGVPVAESQYEYNYDLIGNRNWATDGAGRRRSYSVNEVNQYTEMTIPGQIRRVRGGGTVFIIGLGPGLAASDGVAVERVEPRYDADGNLTDDGRFTYVWDGENRLAGVSNQQSRVAFRYDYLSRRIGKSVFTNTSEAWVPTAESTFVYDGWNLVAETQVSGISTQVSSYVWGLDLSGTLQGAGGIGGLLFASLGNPTTNNSTTVFYAHDGNGNVTDLLDTNGASMAHYEYDPFGSVTALTGPEASHNPFRFSTKYAEAETGLSYYGYRYYSPAQGRWLNRDPIRNRGSRNLYSFVDNDTVNFVDPDGRAIWPFNRRRQLGYEIVVQGTEPTFPKTGVWMCQEELVGKKAVGILHHRFVVVDGDARGFEKRTRRFWGGEGGVRDERQQPLHNDMSCYEMKCLKKDCARRIFDKAVSSGQGQQYWLGYRDCQSWANNVERSMYKECEDCNCSKEDQDVARRNTWKHTGFRDVTLVDEPTPEPEPTPWPLAEPTSGFSIFTF
ncbi:MAG: RHS repeat-associated core domain-containing protein [bacterium]